MSDKIEFDLKEYLEAKFAEQTKLHESHAETTAALFRSIENKLDGVGRTIDGVELKVGGVERKVEGLDGKVEGVDGKVEGLASNVEGVDGKVKGLGNKVEGLDKRLSDLQWSIGILVIIILVAMAGIAVFSFSHVHAQEVTSRNCCEIQRTNLRLEKFRIFSGFSRQNSTFGEPNCQNRNDARATIPIHNSLKLYHESPETYS